MPCIRIAYIRHPEAFVHFFLQIFDNILYVGQNRITLGRTVPDSVLLWSLKKGKELAARLYRTNLLGVIVV